MAGEHSVEVLAVYSTVEIWRSQAGSRLFELNLALWPEAITAWRSRTLAITDRVIDQAFSDLKDSCGGVRNDYFGLVYLEREFGTERERAISHVAFGGNDYGVDGFHFDGDKRNLYLFQFKYADSHAQFKQSFNRLIEDGMERIFGARNQDQHLNQLLLQIKSCLIENEAVIDRVCIHFVFMGVMDPKSWTRKGLFLDGGRH
jgi:hypothetical protein